MTGAPPRRICFVATGLARGGAETQLYRAACGLRDRGFDVHVVCILSHDYYGTRLDEAGIPVTYLNVARGANPLRVLTRFVRVIRELRPDALAGFDYPATMTARLGGAMTRVPVVVSSIRSESLGGKARKAALSWTDSLATVTTTNSAAVGRKLVEIGAASARRVRVIPNGIDVEAINPRLRQQRAELRRSFGVSEREFLWVAAGRLDAPKDYPNLLAAAARLVGEGRSLKLVIAGKGPLLEQVRGQIAALNLGGVVTLAGHREDVPACMAAADATVLGSAWEGLPNVVIESLAVGTPVVSTDVGGVREIVLDGKTGFVVPPRQSAALASAMGALMDCSAEERLRMGAAGRTHIERHFALDQVVDRWSGLFGELFAATAA